jgi:hypothetical protein
MRARLWVHCGIFIISKGGLISFHKHEYLFGILSPFLKTGLVIENNFQVFVSQSEAHVEAKLQEAPNWVSQESA